VTACSVWTAKGDSGAACAADTASIAPIAINAATMYFMKFTFLSSTLLLNIEMILKERKYEPLYLLNACKNLLQQRLPPHFG
jgi:hypothetical protein